MKRLLRAWVLLPCFILGGLVADKAPAQWVQQRSGVRMKLNDVVVLDSVTAIAVGQYGIILKTTNAGLRWVPKNISPIALPRPHWNAVAFGSSSVGVVVGDHLSGAMTTDRGETWRGLFITGTPLPLRNLLSVAFRGPQTIFIGSDSGYALFSFNGGVTWLVQNFGGLPLNDIFFSSLLPEGYIVTPQFAFHTTNLGSTWQSQRLPVLGLGYARRGDVTIDGRQAYAVGADGDFTTLPTILMRARVDTGWRRWNFMPPLPIGWLNDISAPTPEVAFACGRSPIASTTTAGQGMIFKTTNAGQFWSEQFGFRRGLSAVDFLTGYRGFTVGDSGAIYFTANGGGRVINAFPLLSPNNGDTLRVGATFQFRWERAADLEPDTTWYRLYLSTDGPDGPWVIYHGTVDTTTPPSLVPAQGTYWWMVRAEDGTAATTCEEVFSFVTETTVEVGSVEHPREFSLSQNYPNPGNPGTSFQLSIASRQLTVLKIYDLLGREVATLVNEVKQPGTYTVRWDAHGLASGVYLYRFQAGSYMETRKLVLTK